jgi:hypothetical protein
MVAEETQLCSSCSKAIEDGQECPSYSLNKAGVNFCISCCDKWEDIEMSLHQKALTAFLSVSGLSTASGHQLGIKELQWRSESRWRPYSGPWYGDAVDDDGGRWFVKRMRDNLVQLKPKGRLHLS